MTHASLFTGIGGFDLAAEWMGWRNVFQVEIDKWCQRLLAQNFPNVHYRYGDIKQTDFTQWAGRIDVLTGGFPCQPYSVIGEQKGSDDERHLWEQFLRAIREIAPPYITGENVPGIISWNGGMVFDQVCSDLEKEGYHVEPIIIPAGAVGAGHKRDRVWFIAYSAERRLERRIDSNSEGYWQATNRPVQALVEDRDWASYARSYIPRRVHGVSDRVDRIKGLGNAVVPQVVYQIFKAIEQYDQVSHKI